MAESKLAIQVNLPARAVVRALLEKCLDVLPEIELSPPAAADSILPAIGAEWHGGIYAGLTVHDNDPAELILLPGDEELNWKNATTWAEKLGGVLPSRIDQLVLFKNLRDQFKSEAYWSAEQYAGDESSAWYQFFDSGGQNDVRKSAQVRARAVRRVPLSNSVL